MCMSRMDTGVHVGACRVALIRAHVTTHACARAFRMAVANALSRAPLLCSPERSLLWWSREPVRHRRWPQPFSGESSQRANVVPPVVQRHVVQRPYLTYGGEAGGIHIAQSAPQLSCCSFAALPRYPSLSDMGLCCRGHPKTSVDHRPDVQRHEQPLSVVQRHVVQRRSTYGEQDSPDTLGVMAPVSAAAHRANLHVPLLQESSSDSSLSDQRHSVSEQHQPPVAMRPRRVTCFAGKRGRLEGTPMHVEVHSVRVVAEALVSPPKESGPRHPRVGMCTHVCLRQPLLGLELSSPPPAITGTSRPVRHPRRGKFQRGGGGGDSRLGAAGAPFHPPPV